MDTPVLIVGGGPVGLALAGELGWRGIECTLIEQTDGVIRDPKADLVNVRTMEHCRRWGIDGQVRNCPFPDDFARNIIFTTSLTGYELGRIDRPSTAELVPWASTPEKSYTCPQMWFDPILREFADGYSTVNLNYRSRLARFAQDAEGVSAEIVNADGGAETIRAAYMVACDGGNSSVREALKIGLDGHVVSRPVTGYFHDPDFLSRHDRGPAVFYFFVGEKGIWSNIRSIDPVGGIWRYTIVDTPEGASLEEIDIDACLRRSIGIDFPYAWRCVYPWTRRSVVAQSYGRGRVFLSGDAAHQLSPTGAFGANTGISDSVDLGWKLAAVLNGWGGPGLLESYEIERRPIAERNVDQSEANFRRQTTPRIADRLAEDSPAGERQRAEVGAQMLESVAPEFNSEGGTLGYRYDPSAICVPDGTPPPPDDQTTYIQTSRPGSRAPHAWLADGRTTLDLFGEGFTLLRLGDGVDGAEVIKAAAAARQLPLEIVSIADPAICALYEKSLVLVRPDGHVAWRGDAAPANAAAMIDQVRGAAAEPR